MTSVVALAALSLSVAAAGCGGSSTHQHTLAWIGTPQVFAPPDLPRDRIVVGRIHNESKSTLRLQAATLRVRDAQGQVLRSSQGFTASYAHRLFGAFQQPSALPIEELMRLGRIVVLPPGASSPLFAAWRLPPGAHQPVRIDYGRGTLTVPTVTRPTAP